MAQDPFHLRRHAWLEAAVIEREVRRFLSEDVGRGHVTSERVVPKAARASAAMVAREACVVVPDDDPGALAIAARRLLDDERAAIALREGGLRYLAGHHSAGSFTAAMDMLFAGREASERAMPVAPHRRAAAALRAR